jgi:hypothetical protein
MMSYAVITESNNRSSFLINYLSKRDIGEDGQIALQDRIRELLNLSDINCSFNRISSEEKEILFDEKSNDFKEETIDLLKNFGNLLSQHENLKLRINLKPNKENEKAFEEKRNLLKDFFKINNSIEENRLVFGEIASENTEETIQFFVRK